MPSPTENFSDISPVTYDSSSALTHELKVLSERPSPTAPTSRVQDQQSGQRSQPEANPPAEKDKLGWLEGSLLNLSVGAAAVIGAEAIGAYVFKSPQLAEAALESFGASTKIAEAATRTSFVLGKSAIFSATSAGAVAARHYTYGIITGENESWAKSTKEAGIGLLSVRLGKRLTERFFPE